MSLFTRAAAAVLAALVMAACGDGSGIVTRAGNTFVYESRGARQCESDGVSPQLSAQKLIAAGIDVLSSTCGHRTGIAVPAVCGGPTTDILIHEIRFENVPDAERLGFAAVATLADQGVGDGYATIDCDDRTPIVPAQ